MDFRALIQKVIEANLDKVDKKAVMKDFDDRSDKDIDNDGEVDDQDEYLHNKRKAITKAIKKESIDEEALDLGSKTKVSADKDGGITIVSNDSVAGRRVIALDTNQKKQIHSMLMQKASKKMIKDLGSKTKVAYDTDGSMVISSSDMSGKDMVVLDTNQVKKLHNMLMKESIEEARYGRGNMPRDPMFMKAKYDTICPETGKKIKKGEECAYYPNSKKAYHMSSKSANDVRGLNFSKMMGMDEDNQLDEADGWIAMYNGKKLEITKDDAKDLYGAKIHAARQLKVPKGKMGLLAIKPAYNESR